jgi:hypothetical protein
MRTGEAIFRDVSRHWVNRRRSVSTLHRRRKTLKAEISESASNADESIGQRFFNLEKARVLDLR